MTSLLFFLFVNSLQLFDMLLYYAICHAGRLLSCYLFLIYFVIFMSWALGVQDALWQVPAIA
jgi:hypothetical protein